MYQFKNINGQSVIYSFDEKIIILLRDFPFLSNHDCLHYWAQGVDQDRNEYIIKWDIIPGESINFCDWDKFTLTKL